MFAIKMWLSRSCKRSRALRCQSQNIGDKDHRRVMIDSLIFWQAIMSWTRRYLAFSNKHSESGSGWSQKLAPPSFWVVPVSSGLNSLVRGPSMQPVGRVCDLGIVNRHLIGLAFKWKEDSDSWWAPLRKRHLVWSLYEFIFWIKSVRIRFLYEIAREKEHWKNKSSMKFYSLILVKNKVWIRFIHEITREKSLLKVLFLFSLKWLDSNVYFLCVSFSSQENTMIWATECLKGIFYKPVANMLQNRENKLLYGWALD